jgi:hypothetical protein
MSTEHRLIRAGAYARNVQSAWSLLWAVIEGLEHADVDDLHEHADVTLDSLKGHVERMGDELERIEKQIDDLRSLTMKRRVRAGVSNNTHGGMLALHRRLDAAGIPQEDRIDFLEWCGGSGHMSDGRRLDVSRLSTNALRSLFDRFKAAAR